MDRHVLSVVRDSLARAAVCLALATAAQAQTSRTIRGVVIDPADRLLGSVTVIAPGFTSAITDDSGRFHLTISRADRVILDVRRVGFMPSRFGLDAGGDTSITILLLPAAQTLGKVEVTSPENRSVTLAGFEERMRARKHGAGVGYFMTQPEIEAVHATRTTQLLESTPSVMVRRTQGDRFGIYGRTTGGAECAATIFIDGIRLTGGDPATDRRGRAVGPQTAPPLDMYLEPSDVAGVEIYPRGMLAPPALQANDYATIKCAIVAFWTKHR
jgi:hypothetical protein